MRAILAVAMLCASAVSARAEADHAAIARAALSEVIRPGYATLAGAADALQGKMDALCKQPSEPALDQAKQAFAATVAAGRFAVTAAVRRAEPCQASGPGTTSLTRSGRSSGSPRSAECGRERTGRAGSWRRIARGSGNGKEWCGGRAGGSGSRPVQPVPGQPPGVDCRPARHRPCHGAALV